MTATPTSPAEAAAFTILCVDDEPNILSALRRLFRPQGYAVRVANGGVEGLAVLDAEQVDLIISDMRMPGMDGAAFLAEARKRQPDAVRLLLHRVVAEQALPLELKVPNADTVAAMQEARALRRARFASADALLADLDQDD